MPRDYVKYIYARNTIHMPRLVSRASLVLLNLFCNVRFSSPFNSRSPLLPGSVEQRELSEMEDSVAASPPLELRRPSSGPRPTTSVPPSLQSPGDRSTGNVAVTLIGLNRRFHNHFSFPSQTHRKWRKCTSEVLAFRTPTRIRSTPGSTIRPLVVRTGRPVR